MEKYLAPLSVGNLWLQATHSYPGKHDQASVIGHKSCHATVHVTNSKKSLIRNTKKYTIRIALRSTNMPSSTRATLQHIAPTWKLHSTPPHLLLQYQRITNVTYFVDYSPTHAGLQPSATHPATHFSSFHVWIKNACILVMFVLRHHHPALPSRLFRQKHQLVAHEWLTCPRTDPALVPARNSVHKRLRKKIIRPPVTPHLPNVPILIFKHLHTPTAGRAEINVSNLILVQTPASNLTLAAVHVHLPIAQFLTSCHHFHGARGAICKLEVNHLMVCHVVLTLVHTPSVRSFP